MNSRIKPLEIIMHFDEVPPDNAVDWYDSLDRKLSHIHGYLDAIAEWIDLRNDMPNHEQIKKGIDEVRSSLVALRFMNEVNCRVIEADNHEHILDELAPAGNA